METFFNMLRRRTDGKRQEHFRDAYAASRCRDDRSTPEKITWCYGEWQSAYATMDLVDVLFEEGLPVEEFIIATEQACRWLPNAK